MRVQRRSAVQVSKRIVAQAAGTAIPRYSSRRSAGVSELACTIPASVKVGGVFFMAMRTKRHAALGLGPLDLMDKLTRLRRFALIHDPYLRPCLVKRNFAHDALCILVEHAGVDARLRKQASHKMGIRKRRGRIDFQHLESVTSEKAKTAAHKETVPPQRRNLPFGLSVMPRSRDPAYTAMRMVESSVPRCSGHSLPGA